MRDSLWFILLLDLDNGVAVVLLEIVEDLTMARDMLQVVQGKEWAICIID